MISNGWIQAACTVLILGYRPIPSSYCCNPVPLA